MEEYEYSFKVIDLNPYIEYCESNNVKYINYFYHEELVENKKSLKDKDNKNESK